MENSRENQHRPWTWLENKTFEEELAKLGDGTADRWRTIAGFLYGRSPEEVEEQYNLLVDDVLAIESGVVPLPNYSDDVASDVAEVAERRVVARKKGQPWTEEEQKLFLKGLEIYGKGDWRSISRNCVKTRTSTQVASHAQKYFNRKNLTTKPRRSSIHDITLKPDEKGSSSGSENNANVNFVQNCSSNEQVSNGFTSDIHISNYGDQILLQNQNSTGINSITINTDDHVISPQSQFSSGLLYTNDQSDSRVISLQNGGVFMGNCDTNYSNDSFAIGQGNYNGAGPSNSRMIDLQSDDFFMGNGTGNYVNNRSVLPRASLPYHQANANCAIYLQDGDALMGNGDGNYVNNCRVYQSVSLPNSSPAQFSYPNIHQGSKRHIPDSHGYTNSDNNHIMPNCHANAYGASS